MDGTAVRNDTTLRLALGMRGGVSLAVWIGGAAAELDDLRRADPTHDCSFYDRLLAVGRYDSVEIDVMSGASAGGLNAVLAACAMVGSNKVADMRQTWLDVASLRDLLESHDGGDLNRRSLLGGEFFTKHIRERVEALLTSPNTAPGEPPARLGHRVDVFLSGTVLNGMSVSIAEDPYSSDSAKRSGAFFHFRHFSNDPAVSDVFGADTIDTLAKAARTTASFPGAFEPIVFEPGEMPGVLLLPGTTDAPIRMLDGGVIDNIPVARAISGVPNIPSRTLTDRWILYLQPSPSSISAEMPSPDDDGSLSPGVTGVVAGIVGAFMSESILDDIEVLRRHNADATEAAREWSVAVDDLLGAPTTATVTNTPVDAARIVALLIDPARELVWRPLHKAVPRGPLASVSGADQTKFRANVDRTVVGCTRLVRPFAPIARSAALLIRWARSVERSLLSIEGDERTIQRDRDRVGALKLATYQLMHLAQLLTANNDWQLLFMPSPLDADAAVRRLQLRADAIDGDAAIIALVADLPIGSADLAAAVNVPAHRDLLLALHSCEYQPPSERQDSASVQTAMWARLGSYAGDLSELARQSAAPVDEVFSALASAIDDHSCDPVGLLIAIDQRTVAVHHGVACGVPDALKYLRLAGSNLSPLSVNREQLPHDGPRFSSTQLTVAADETMVLSRFKLAGSDLSNFSAFISQRWRANDWMWGRLDAAKSIVDLVTSPQRLPSDPDIAFAAIDSAMTSPLVVDAMSPPSWSGELETAVADAWITNRATVLDELQRADSDVEPQRLRVTKQLLVLRRHWEILANELPIVEAASLRPVPPKPKSAADIAAAAPRTLAAAVADYERSPRSFGQVWGTRWLTALGIRAAFAFWAATPPRTTWKRWARAPLKPLPMTVLGVALSRNRGLLAMALSWNLVLVPRMYNAGAWFAVLLGLGLGGGLAWLYRARDSGGRPIPFERFGRAYLAATAVVFVAGVVIVASNQLREWLYGDRFMASSNNSLSDYLTPYTIMAGCAAAATTWLLWCWATTAWRIASSLSVALITGAWAVFGRMQPDVDANWVTQFVYRFDAIGWALFIAVWLTTTVAHFAFHRHWPISEYDAD